MGTRKNSNPNPNFELKGKPYSNFSSDSGNKTKRPKKIVKQAPETAKRTKFIKDFALRHPEAMKNLKKAGKVGAVASAVGLGALGINKAIENHKQKTAFDMLDDMYMEKIAGGSYDLYNTENYGTSEAAKAHVDNSLRDPMKRTSKDITTSPMEDALNQYWKTTGRKPPTSSTNTNTNIDWQRKNFDNRIKRENSESAMSQYWKSVGREAPKGPTNAKPDVEYIKKTFGSNTNKPEFNISKEDAIKQMNRRKAAEKGLGASAVNGVAQETVKDGAKNGSKVLKYLKKGGKFAIPTAIVAGTAYGIGKATSGNKNNSDMQSYASYLDDAYMEKQAIAFSGIKLRDLDKNKKEDIKETDSYRRSLSPDDKKRFERKSKNIRDTLYDRSDITKDLVGNGAMSIIPIPPVALAGWTGLAATGGKYLRSKRNAEREAMRQMEAERNSKQAYETSDDMYREASFAPDPLVGPQSVGSQLGDSLNRTMDDFRTRRLEKKVSKMQKNMNNMNPNCGKPVCASDFLDSMYMEKQASTPPYILTLPLMAGGFAGGKAMASTAIERAAGGSDNRDGNKKHVITRLSDMPKTSGREGVEQEAYLDNLSGRDIRRINNRAKRNANKYYNVFDEAKDFGLTAVPTYALMRRSLKKGKVPKAGLATAIAGTTIMDAKKKRAAKAGLTDAINEHKQQNPAKQASDILDDMYKEAALPGPKISGSSGLSNVGDNVGPFAKATVKGMASTPAPSIGTMNTTMPTGGIGSTVNTATPTTGSTSVGSTAKSAAEECLNSFETVLNKTASEYLGIPQEELKPQDSENMAIKRMYVDLFNNPNINW